MSLLYAITKLSIDYHQIHRGITMRKRTQQIRLAELIRDIGNHPHKEELIKLMDEQVFEDTIIVN